MLLLLLLLPTLQERPKWQQEKRNLHVGDIVLMADDNVARNQWALGRVENVGATLNDQ